MLKVTEERIIRELQWYLWQVHDAQERDDEFARDYWQSKFLTCVAFAGSITGKSFEAENWAVKFKEV